jgi:hypothetical protein
MLSLATNTEVHDGVAPNRARVQPEFPYYGAPFYQKGANRPAGDPG